MCKATKCKFLPPLLLPQISPPSSFLFPLLPPPNLNFWKFPFLLSYTAQVKPPWLLPQPSMAYVQLPRSFASSTHLWHQTPYPPTFPHKPQKPSRLIYTTSSLLEWQDFQKYSTIVEEKKASDDSGLRLINIREQCLRGRVVEGDLVAEEGVIGKNERGRKHKPWHKGRKFGLKKEGKNEEE